MIHIYYFVKGNISQSISHIVLRMFILFPQLGNKSLEAKTVLCVASAPQCVFVPPLPAALG